MGKKEDLEALTKAISDSNIRLHTLRAHIISLSNDIEQFSQLEGNLIDNIKYLKKNKVITGAESYKKAKDDLAKTVIKVVSLMNDRETLRKEAKLLEILIADAQKKLDKLQKYNVLQGDFRRKNGKE
jgi:chromosome segregation ATPase